MQASIAAIATHVPEQILSNETLAKLYPAWPADKILEKTGIRTRHIAAENETAVDLAARAAEKLFARGVVAREDVDFLILCSQAPDYILPTSACILQNRLGLRTSTGALDINLGCSGFVYGLALANGLIASGAASNILLLTADTYSKFIHPLDKSVRTLFGDGAAATLICRTSFQGNANIGPFVFGTDGAGANELIVESGGQKLPRNAETAVETIDRADNVRSRDHLYMNGGEVLNFTLREVPRAVAALLQKTGSLIDDYDMVVLHQANKFMLDALQKKLKVADERFPRHFEDIGNTVSSTIPFVLEHEMAAGNCSQGRRAMLVGFGVGLSWAATSVVF